MNTPLAGAEVIVTHNTKDFPPDKLPSGLATILPAEFAANTVALHPLRALAAVEAIIERSGRKGHKRDHEWVFTALTDRYDMIDAVELMRQHRK